MATPSSRRFTETGQCLAFIHACALVNRRPPAEADIRRFFAVTRPSVHNMLRELERSGQCGKAPLSASSQAYCSRLAWSVARWLRYSYGYARSSRLAIAQNPRRQP
jgi:hypothetical protein